MFFVIYFDTDRIKNIKKKFSKENDRNQNGQDTELTSKFSISSYHKSWKSWKRAKSAICPTKSEEYNVDEAGKKSEPVELGTITTQPLNN